MEHIKQLSIILVAVFVLSSCQSLKEMRAKRLAAQAAADRAQCLDMGFKSGTDTFLLCLDNRRLERKADAAASAARRAKEEAEDAAMSATMNCIMSGGIMAGNTCL